MRDFAAERLDLCRRAEQLKRVGKKYFAGRHSQKFSGGENAGGFIRSKVPDADVVVHPYSGEAGAIGAAFVSLDWYNAGGRTHSADSIQSHN